jgi:bifunctional non-homologous end joining protein LigD
VLPIAPSLGWDEAKAFTKAIADAFTAAQPDRYTAVMAKKARRGRLFIDYLRNGRGSTAVGAFSTRARPGATVSVPLTWDEVEAGVRSDAFGIRTVPGRLKKLKRDPWEGWKEAARQSLEKAIRKLG